MSNDPKPKLLIDYELPSEEEPIERWQHERIENIMQELRRLDKEGHLFRYLEDVVRQIVIECADADYIDWPANLHLSDVIRNLLK